MPTRGGHWPAMLLGLAIRLQAIEGVVVGNEVATQDQSWLYYTYAAEDWARRARAAGCDVPEPRSEELTRAFAREWKRVRAAHSRGPLEQVLPIARAMPAPIGLVPIRGKGNDGFRTLVNVCRVLQLNAGEKPFFLSQRLAAEVILGDCRKQQKMGEWIRLLMGDEGRPILLRRLSEGSHLNGRASEYRWLGEPAEGFVKPGDTEEVA